MGGPAGVHAQLGRVPREQDEGRAAAGASAIRMARRDWHQDIEMYNLARRAGKQCVMLVYPGENHALA